MIKIVDALISLGCKEFTVTSNSYEGIEWIVEPDFIPTKEEVLAKVAELEITRQTELEAKAAQKAAILERLGLTEEELKVVLS